MSKAVDTPPIEAVDSATLPAPGEVAEPAVGTNAEEPGLHPPGDEGEESDEYDDIEVCSFAHGAV